MEVANTLAYYDMATITALQGHFEKLAKRFLKFGSF